MSISIELSNPNQAMANFLSTFMASRTQAHIFHLQITGPGSYAAHIALQAYYEGIIPLIDALAESFQGRYGIIAGYKSEGQWIENTKDVVKYFEALSMYVEKNRQSLSQDSYIQNQVDTFVELIESTKYKLSKLM
jgi:DNA-binding ferritin-like protein